MSTSLQIKVGCVCVYVIAATVTVVCLLAEAPPLHFIIVATALG